MAQPAALAATRIRDDGRTRARRLTWWAAVGAAAVTGMGAAIAASTLPGRTVDQAQPTAASSSGGSANGADSSGGSGGASDPGSGSFNPPAQAPQSGSGSGPLVVSGGS